MAKDRNYQKKLTVPEQIVLMGNAHPQFKLRPMRNKVTGRPIPLQSAAVWIGKVRPTGVSRDYQIKISYKFAEPPKVSVIAPKLVMLAGAKRLPHTYPDGRLCLYTPAKGEWLAHKSIASSIVPWTSLWLFYYEAWLITGVWHGDGTEPGEEKPSGD